MTTKPDATGLTMSGAAEKLRSSVFPKRKAQWENPESSIGTPCPKKLGMNHCWKAICPASEQYLKFAEKITTILEENIELINKGEAVLTRTTFSLYMVGRRTTTARPFIIFCDERPNTRRRALEIIKGSQIFKRYPGFGLGDCSHPPEFYGPPGPLASRAQELPSDPVLRHSVDAIFFRPSRKTACGTEITVLSNTDGTPRKATLGGIILSQNECFGMTVAHVFDPIDLPATTAKHAEFEYNLGDYDENQEEDDDYSGESITGSTSSEPFQIGLLSNSSNSSEDPVAQDTQFEQSSSDARGTGKPSPKANEGNAGGKQEADDPLAFVGYLERTSAERNLDWALMKLEDPTLQTYNCISSGQRMIYIECIMTMVAEEAQVITAVGSGGVLNGTISPTPTFALMPGTEVFQELWTVDLASKLSNGDCGSWIIDVSTGNMYGHIVLGLQGSGTAYIVPAYRIYEDIREHFSPDIQLSTRANSTEEFKRLNRTQFTLHQQYRRNEQLLVEAKQAGSVASQSWLGPQAAQSKVEWETAKRALEDYLQRSAKWKEEELLSRNFVGSLVASESTQVDPAFSTPESICTSWNEVDEITTGHDTSTETTPLLPLEIRKPKDLGFFPHIAILDAFRWLYSCLLALFWATEIEVTMLGLQNSGKTSLLRVLTGNDFTLDSIPTVGLNIKFIRKGKVTMRCCDMGGQPRFRSMWQRYSRGTDAIVFVIDSADTEAFSVAKDELHLLLEDAYLEGISLLVLCNKTDLEEKLSAREILEGLEIKNLRGRSLACYEVSAKEGTNLDLVLKWLVNRGGRRNSYKNFFER